MFRNLPYTKGRGWGFKRILCTGGSGFIGTHLVSSIIQNELFSLLNIDIQKPKLEKQIPYWYDCDILNSTDLYRVIKEFKPTHIIHLAAETDVNGNSLDFYAANTIGTKNLLNIIKTLDCVEQVIVTSSQHVRAPGYGLPKHDQDFVPYKYYGESKVVSERITREINLNCTWTIIRPTTIWGPLHDGLANGLWRVMRQGKYFHPKNDQVIRSYGYVGNVVYQIEKLLSLPNEVVNRKVLYLGDPCVKQIEWVNGFSQAISGKVCKEIPIYLLGLLSKIGDSMRALGLGFPLYTDRLRNMITSNPVPIEHTIEIIGISPYTFQDGVQYTLQWLRDEKGF